MRETNRRIVRLALLLTLIFAGALVAAPAFAGRGGQDTVVVFVEGPGAAALQGQHDVRHVFPTGFTTELLRGAADRLAQRSGIRVSEVPLWHLLGGPPVDIAKPPGKCDPWPECKNGDGGGDPGGDPARPAVPSDPTPWGIQWVYNDATVNSTSGGAGIAVAVLDTWVFKDHLDLTRRVAQCADFTGGGPPGTVRVRDGRCDDQNGHGTHTAGTALADGGSDGLGVFGVAPGADLFAYKVCGNSGCWSDDIAAAIDRATAQGAAIISMSLGGDTESALVADAIQRAVTAGVLIVAAAGNDGPALGSIDYPGANVNVVAVGVIDSSQNVPSWSSRGVNDGDYVVEVREVEVGAPGVSVESTWNDGAYNTISGKSMATPHIAGLAAKVWASGVSDANSNGTTADEVRSWLQTKAKARDLHTAGDDTATEFGGTAGP